MLERKAWSLAPPAGRPTAAILFLDAELYLQRVGAAAVVRRLLERRAIPPAVAVFLSAGGAAARHEDFVCRRNTLGSSHATSSARSERNTPA
jgi:enterochelin esterase-like enzyme